MGVVRGIALDFHPYSIIYGKNCASTLSKMVPEPIIQNFSESLGSDGQSVVVSDLIANSKNLSAAVKVVQEELYGRSSNKDLVHTDIGTIVRKGEYEYTGFGCKSLLDNGVETTAPTISVVEYSSGSVEELETEVGSSSFRDIKQLVRKFFN